MLTQFVIFAGNNMSGTIGLKKVENIKKIYIVTFHFIPLPGGPEVFSNISKKMFFVHKLILRHNTKIQRKI